MHLKMSSAKWRSFCPGEDQLINMTSQYICVIRHVYILSQMNTFFQGKIKISKIVSAHMVHLACLELGGL